jgi:hypothetical protein
VAEKVYRLSGVWDERMLFQRSNSARLGREKGRLPVWNAIVCVAWWCVAR